MRRRRYDIEKTVKFSYRMGRLVRIELPALPATEERPDPDKSLLARAYREVKSWAFALMAAGGLLAIGAPYALPSHLSLEQKCMLAKDVHNDYLQRAPQTARERTLSELAERGLERCLNG